MEANGVDPSHHIGEVSCCAASYGSDAAWIRAEDIASAITHSPSLEHLGVENLNILESSQGVHNQVPVSLNSTSTKDQGHQSSTPIFNVPGVATIVSFGHRF